MSTSSTVAPIKRSVVVEASVEKAFDVFTADFGSWFPKEYNLLDTPIAERTFEPRVGGHVFDRGEDGKECHWSRVLVYEPPNRVVFSWDISPTWQIETDPDKTSEVEVNFIPEGPDRTRIELEHRNIERHGDGGASLRESIDGDSGWVGVLAGYAERVAATA